MRPACLLLLAASAAHAGTNELVIDRSTRALRSSSADALTAGGLDGAALGYARDLHLPLLPGLALWGELETSWGGSRGLMFQTLTTDIGAFAVTAGGRARYAVASHVVASAHVDVGLARASLELADGAGHSASDHGWAPTARGALCLDLLAIDRHAFSLGVRLELGYVATAGVELTAQPASTSAGTLQLDMMTASLGHLDLSGPAFAAGIVSQF